jgi:phosphodiester glycosidase
MIIMNRGKIQVSASRFAKALLIIVCFSFISFKIPRCEEPPPLLIGDLEVLHTLPLNWRKIEPGFCSGKLRFRRVSDGQLVKMESLRVDPKKFNFRILSAPKIFTRPSAWVDKMAVKQGAFAAINASFYLPETWVPTGLVISDGKVFTNWVKGAGSGVFRVRGDRAYIEWSSKLNPDWQKSDVAVQSGPLIIEPGGKPGIYKNTNKRRTRTAAGIDARGNVILICLERGNQIESDISGLDLYELMEIMLVPEEEGGLALKEAINFDGGTSSAMIVRHPGYSFEIKSTHEVRNGLAIFPK